MNRIFDDEQERNITKMYQSGMSVRQVAEKVYCDPQTVARIIKRNGGTTRPRHVHPEQERAQIIEMYKRHRNNGRCHQLVAQALGLPLMEVQSVIGNELRRGRL